MKNILTGIGVLGILALVVLQFSPPLLGGGPGRTAQHCDVTTSANVVVGASDQVTQILAAHSLRAWAIVQKQFNSTSTVSLSFDEGAQAVSGAGFTVTTTTPAVFGANTDFVYTGAVTAVTDVGTSTVAVTECRY